MCKSVSVCPFIFNNRIENKTFIPFNSNTKCSDFSHWFDSLADFDKPKKDPEPYIMKTKTSHSKVVPYKLRFES